MKSAEALRSDAAKKTGVFADKYVDKGEKQKDWFDQAPQKDLVIIE